MDEELIRRLRQDQAMKMTLQKDQIAPGGIDRAKEQIFEDQAMKMTLQDQIAPGGIDRAKEQILEDQALKMALQDQNVSNDIDRAKEQILEDRAMNLTLQDQIAPVGIDWANEQMHQDQAMNVIQGQFPVSMIAKERSDRLVESFLKEISTTDLTEKDQVFIVHGRDDSSKKNVYQFLTDLGLEPIILHEQPNKGRTIIEKFEDHSSNVKYAVVLLTPDDLGGLAAEPNKTLPRARQNVVFEMGYFFGRFGRERVCALLSSEVERPSDIDGIMYIQLSQNEEWKSSLLRELKDAGLNIGNFE